MLYRRRRTPLHAAGPAAAMAWCAALLLGALISSNQVVLGVLAVSVLAAWWPAQIAGQLRRVLPWLVGFAAVIWLINALVSEQGTTILWRFGTLPLVGYRYVTLQAVAAGGLLALRGAVLVLIGMLYSLTVDPDAVLLAARRVSLRSALAVSIATRMVPLLLRDSHRLADAQRTRSGDPPGRIALLQAATNGMLDRALEMAATLEVRGFGLPGAGTASHRLRTRHDRNFLLSAVLLAAALLAARLVSAWFAAAVPVAALAPFLDRRGVG